MTGDFNIRDCSWDPNFCFHSIHKDTLLDIADSFHLIMSEPTNHIPTRYSDNQQESDSVIDLMFLRPTLSEYNNHSIHPDWHLISDHTPLTVNIAILKEDIQMRKYTIIKNSKEEDNFIIELTKAIKGLNTEDIQSKKVLEHIIQSFADCTEQIWYKHSKEWWDENCHRDLELYSLKIQEIANKKCSPWKLINWVKK